MKTPNNFPQIFNGIGHKALNVLYKIKTAIIFLKRTTNTKCYPSAILKEKQSKKTKQTFQENNFKKHIQQLCVTYDVV